MYTSTFTYLLLASATTTLATPLLHRKRYDLDRNGIPDFCYTDFDCIAHCLKTNRAWTSFPATSCTISSTSTSAWTAVATQTTTSTTSTSTSATTSSNAATTTQVASTSESNSASLPTGTLPSPSQFAADKGTEWTIDYVGDLQFTGTVGSQKLGGDKCRTGKIGDQVIWNCGDMECNGDWSICGFSMGPAFYGTSDVMTVNTSSVVQVEDNNFLQPWSGDPTPVSPQWTWGMDTSNVAPINDTHGVAYAWEIWRGASDGSVVNRGNAVAAITLGSTMPVATRVGPLLTDENAIGLGLLAILSDGDYIYTYSMGGPSNVIVGRVAADDSVFDATKYSFLSHGSTTNWVSGIPSSSTTSIGATTDDPSGQFGCGVYGSIFYSNYLNQYVIICDIDLSWVNMYTSPTPYGPWSAGYGLLSTSDAYVAGSYGSMVHIEYSPGGSAKEVYFSLGSNGLMHMFKMTFNY